MNAAEIYGRLNGLATVIALLIVDLDKAGVVDRMNLADSLRAYGSTRTSDEEDVVRRDIMAGEADVLLTMARYISADAEDPRPSWSPTVIDGGQKEPGDT